jgi:hypothetical protein
MSGRVTNTKSVGKRSAPKDDSDSDMCVFLFLACAALLTVRSEKL